MEKQPRDRYPFQTFFWPLFVEACGNRCCGECGQPGTAETLQRGHIRSHQNEGEAAPENLMPVCVSCNSKAQGEDMPDNRPPAWRDRFARLFLGALGVEISLKIEAQKGCAGVETACAGVNGTHTTDSKEVISWENLVFTPKNSYSQPSLRPLPSPSLAEVENALTAAINLGRGIGLPSYVDLGVTIVPPFENARRRLEGIIRHHGCADFLVGVKEFLRLGEWYDHEELYPKPGGGLPWQTFADNFSIYLDSGRRFEVRLAKQRAAEKEARDKRLAEEAAQKAEYERQRRAELPAKIAKVAWAEMTEEDKAFRKRMAGFNPAQPLCDEDAAYADDYLARFAQAKAVMTGFRKRLDKEYLAMIARAVVTGEATITDEFASLVEKIRKHHEAEKISEDTAKRYMDEISTASKTGFTRR